MKKGLFVLLFLVLSYLGYSFLSCKSDAVNPNTAALIETTQKRVDDQLKVIKEFLRKNPNYNSEIVFLVDMKIMSGKNRFFIYDLNQNKIIDQGLVAHGSGSETEIENELKFSNADNSLATSVAFANRILT